MITSENFIRRMVQRMQRNLLVTLGCLGCLQAVDAQYIEPNPADQGFADQVWWDGSATAFTLNSPSTSTGSYQLQAYRKANSLWSASFSSRFNTPSQGGMVITSLVVRGTDLAAWINQSGSGVSGPRLAIYDISSGALSLDHPVQQLSSYAYPMGGVPTFGHLSFGGGYLAEYVGKAPVNTMNFYKKTGPMWALEKSISLGYASNIGETSSLVWMDDDGTQCVATSKESAGSNIELFSRDPNLGWRHSGHLIVPGRVDGQVVASAGDVVIRGAHIFSEITRMPISSDPHVASTRSIEVWSKSSGSWTWLGALPGTVKSGYPTGSGETRSFLCVTDRYFVVGDQMASKGAESKVGAVYWWDMSSSPLNPLAASGGTYQYPLAVSGDRFARVIAASESAPGRLDVMAGIGAGALVFLNDLTGSSNQAPTVTAATASPSTVSGKSSNLTVTATDDAGESGLIYTWNATPTTIAFMPNGTNSAKTTTATFSAAGNYTLSVTARDAGGRTATRTVAISVTQTPTTLAVIPSSANVAVSTSRSLSVAVQDQFQDAIVSPVVAWSVVDGLGTVSSAGLFTAPATTGTTTIRASCGAATSTAVITSVAGDGDGAGQDGSGSTKGGGCGMGGGLAVLLTCWFFITSFLREGNRDRAGRR